MGRALYLLPVGRLLPEGHLRGTRPAGSCQLGRVQGELRGHPRLGSQVFHHRHEVPVDRGRLVRLPEHAHQRLRLPHAARRRRDQLGRRPCQADLRQLARADRHGRVHRQPPDLQLAGSASVHGQRRRGALPDGQLRRGASARRRSLRRPARLLPVSGHHLGHRTVRGRADRHLPHSGKRREQGSGARVPALCRLARRADRDQQRQQPGPASGQRNVVGRRRQVPERRLCHAVIEQPRRRRPVLGPRCASGNGQGLDGGLPGVHGQA